MKERLANVIRWMGRIWLILMFLLILYHIYESINGNYPRQDVLISIATVALFPCAVILSVAYIIDGKIDRVLIRTGIAFVVATACLFIVNNFQTKTNVSANSSSKQTTGKEWWANDQVVAPDISKLSNKELIEMLCQSNSTNCDELKKKYSIK